MPSRLSSLLVRDGLVGVKRMEKAFQRQVIYGGSLDTILLEMGLVPEERLTQYLALASGLPPAERDEGAVLEPAALAVVDATLAEHYRAVPLAIEGDALRVLVCSPLEISELEDLADQLDRPLQPLITPEYRWHLVFAAAYGQDPPARYTTLARQLAVDPTVPPVGRTRSIIIEPVIAAPPDEAVDTAIVDEPTSPNRAPDFDHGPTREFPEIPSLAPIGGDRPTLRMTAPELEAAGLPVPPIQAADPARRSQRTTLIGVRASAAETAVPHAAVDDGSGSTGVPRPVLDTNPARRTRPMGAARVAPSRPAPPSGATTPLPVPRARELLATAEERDQVFLTVLRALRGRARWAGLLTVQGGAAIGRLALAEEGVDTAAITNVLIPLDGVSPFRAVISGHQPHIGPLVSGDPSVDAMVLRMGGTMPASALILPIVLRDRVVALLVAHRGHSDLKLVDVAELLPLGALAAEALGRLIVKHKAAGYRTPEAPVTPAVPLVETKPMRRAPSAPPPHEVRLDDRVETGGWTAPSTLAVPPLDDLEIGTEVSMEAEAPRPIDDVLAEIEHASESEAEDAMSDLVERASETLAAIARRFPGRLRVDRFAVTGRPLRAAQYGGLLELVIRLGPIAADLLIEKMAAPQRDLRFYATVCAAELRPRTAVYALVDRIFDQDYGVRALAIEALAGYPLVDLDAALLRARTAVHSDDPERVGAATAALVELGDVAAIPELLGALERGERTAEHARRALVELTAQDFGTSERKWRKWWDLHQRRHRVEWLIDGLAHKEDAIRASAIHTLRRLTGEYFGYHHDLARRERELARDRWLAWWREAGQRRFVTREDERHRPTAVLPIRRD